MSGCGGHGGVFEPRFFAIGLLVVSIACVWILTDLFLSLEEKAQQRRSLEIQRIEQHKRFYLQESSLTLCLGKCRFCLGFESNSYISSIVRGVA